VNKKYYEIAAIMLLLGSFPALFLPTLQFILLIVLIGLVLSFRHPDRAALKQLLSFRYLAFAQFCILFFINAVIYPVWDNPKAHYRAIALESWSISLFCLIVLALWLNMRKADDVKRAILYWLPVGLSVSFFVASWFYFLGDQGSRVTLFTPSPLIPPFWFLVLTAASFGWFFEMSHLHRAWRIAIFFMAGLMAVYGGARLVMLAWVLCGIVLMTWGCIQSDRKYRLRIFTGASLFGAVCVGGIILVDLLSEGGFLGRMAKFAQVEFSYESIGSQFLRAQIWSGALSIIPDNIWIGVGQVNERAAISQEMDWDRWLRAHQTYLSYLIAGGIPALISGLIMQSPMLIFLKRTKRSALFPVFLGLGVVVTLNCFTDSIFQSAVNVQVFMVTTLLFLKASDADQPTLAPQKQVSSAIM
jgi:hypothetical protein